MTRQTSSITMAYRLNYAFELRNGGVGYGTAVTTTATSGHALPFAPGEQITVYNDGSVAVWFAVGASKILATTGCTPIPPGSKEVFTIPNDGRPYTHISFVTRTGTSFATVNIGFGS
jgi:hypothetical protein